MTQQLAALDIYIIVFELQELIGSYIDKIYQLSSDEVIIRINNRKSKQKEFLYANSKGFFFQTKRSFETPMKPSTFAMTLRKHISNGRIIAIEQHEFDRIIKIKIQKKEKYILIFELIPNGNILLLNQDELIIMPLKHQHWSHRSIRINTQYQPPPSQTNPFTLTYETFDKILQDSNADLVRTFAVKFSLGGRYAEELCSHIDISKKTMAKQLSTNQRKNLFTQFQAFIHLFKTHSFSPILVTLEDRKEITPFPFTIYETKEKKQIQSFSKGLEKTIIFNKQKTNSSPIEKKKQQLLRQQNQQQKAIKSFDKKINGKKHQGDIIYLHYNTIEKLISEIQKNRKLFTKKELITHIIKKEIVKDFSTDSPVLTLTLPDEHQHMIDIQIDYRKSVAENAEASYHQSKKLSQKKQGAIKALKQTKQKIKSIEKQTEKEIQKQSEQAKQKEITKKHFWFEQYRWSISSNGNLILGGKDAKTNDQLIKKHLEKNDRYAHADIHGAPSCIIKNKNIDDKTISITDESLQETCMFSVCYSRAWKQFAEAQAYWVRPEQVSKTPQSGEFVPRGAFIIRGKRNYCTCKMKLGIGKIIINNTEKILGGSPSAIKKWCDQFVLIEPGTKKSSIIAKEIADILHSNSTLIQQVLPAGKSQIISTHKKKINR